MKQGGSDKVEDLLRHIWQTIKFSDSWCKLYLITKLPKHMNMKSIRASLRFFRLPTHKRILAVLNHQIQERNRNKKALNQYIKTINK